ncbi:MAG TPA: PEP-CTERM sorting domain-containing protein, partial [Gammaproteobacteria bacterium]|nr:PEP-CTERM sorting domain-containing protein [Gammaproteobacteria bacterium]
GSGTLLLGDTYDYFGLYWGSVDTYNYLSFYLGDVLVDMFSGSDLAGLSANGKQTWWGSNRYVNFYFNDGDLFDRVVVRSDGYAFESDNHAYASTSLQRTALTVTVPEPGTLFLLGVGLLGIVVIQRRRGGALLSGTRPRVARI